MRSLPPDHSERRPMTSPDRVRPSAVVAALALTLLVGSAHGQGGGSDKDRLDRIERRLDALEQRLGGGAPPRPAPNPAAPAASASAPAAAGEASPYLPGAVAVVRVAPASSRQLSEPPVDSVGGFIYTGGPITLHDLQSRGVRYNGLAGIELQGWLAVTQAGRTQLGEDLRATFGQFPIVGPDCILQVWLEDRQIGADRQTMALAKNQGKATLVAGADLQPGLYKLRLWTACVPASNPREARITADLLVKGPGDLNLRGFKPDELLHQP